MKPVRPSSPEAMSQDPLDPERRLVLRRVLSSLMVASAAGIGAYTFYQSNNPIRTHARNKIYHIPDHRIQLPTTSPQMVIARGKDPAKNVQAALARLGGMNLFISKGDVVVIKPNVAWDRTPEQAANTNPLVIQTLVQSCLAVGAAKVLVTDNPVNDPERCFVRSGIQRAAQQGGGRIVLPSATSFHMVDILGRLGRWPVLEPFITANKIINVPVVKHHSLTHATIGMKNWYGILGGRRNQLHQRIDESLAELAALMRPTLTVIDATRMLMRNGPTGGSLADVKENNAVLISIDPIAADAWGASQLDLDPLKLPWLKLGESKQLGTIDYRSLSPIEINVG